MVVPIKKGTAFEVQISSALSEFKCVTLPNISIYSHWLDRYTEIDRLILTPWKVYCIEAKAFNTQLQGNIADAEWTGSSGQYQRSLYNPVAQNFEHIRSLNINLRKVGCKPIKIENYVVVPDTCRIVTDVDCVINVSTLAGIFRRDSLVSKRLDVKQVVDGLKKIKVV